MEGIAVVLTAGAALLVPASDRQTEIKPHAAIVGIMRS